MRELTVEDMLELHALGIAQHGGSGVVPATAPDRIASILNAATYNAGILGYAAGILCYTARAQHFVDGNKRVAWLGCVRALEINGFYLRVEDAEAVSFVQRIVIENLDAPEIADTLGPWCEVLK